MDINRLRVGTENDLRRKLTDEDREQIKKLRAEGHSYEVIAMNFSVTTSAIYKFLNPHKKSKNTTKRPYDAEKSKAYRDRKKKLFAEGKIGQRETGQVEEDPGQTDKEESPDK